MFSNKIRSEMELNYGRSKYHCGPLICYNLLVGPQEYYMDPELDLPSSQKKLLYILSKRIQNLWRAK